MSETLTVAEGRRLYVQRDYVRAFEMLLPLAEAGMADAQFLVGDMYESGWGCTADREAGRRYIEAAAAKDQPDACMRMCDSVGLDPSESEMQKFRHWGQTARRGFRIRSEVGDALAMQNLGVCYQLYRGTDAEVIDRAAEDKMAEEWFIRAYDAGFHFAANNLCVLYCESTLKSPEKAFYWQGKAKDAGCQYVGIEDVRTGVSPWRDIRNWLTARATTLSHSRFRTALLGIGLPLVCLVFDPIVFRSAIFGPPLLGAYKPLAYSFILLSMFALATWLVFQRFPSFFCGVLAAGCLVAFALGMLLLPFSIIGLFSIIGILGFSPFPTAVAYGSSATLAYKMAGKNFKPWVAASAYSMTIALPVVAQVGVSHVTQTAITALVNGPDESVGEAVRELRMLGPFFDPDQFIQPYTATKSEPARQRLDSAHRQLTGSSIDSRKFDD